jgi:hypothetical protein
MLNLSQFYPVNIATGLLVYTVNDQTIDGIKTFNDMVLAPEIRGTGVSGAVKKIDLQAGQLYSDPITVSLDYWNRILSGNWSFEHKPNINGSGIVLSDELSLFPNSIVYTTGDQNINGIKNFIIKPLMLNSQPVLFSEISLFSNIIVYKTGNQTIDGLKNFSLRPTVNNTNVSLNGDAYTNVNIISLNTGLPFFITPARKAFYEINSSNIAGIVNVYLPSGENCLQGDQLNLTFSSSGCIYNIYHLDQINPIVPTGIYLFKTIESGFNKKGLNLYHQGPNGRRWTSIPVVDEVYNIIDNKNCVFTTGDQNINGVKTFNNNVNMLKDVYISGDLKLNTINGNTSFGVYNYNFFNNAIDSSNKQASYLNSSNIKTGIRNGDLVNFYFEKDFYSTFLSTGFVKSRTLKVNPGILIDINSADTGVKSSRNLIKFNNNSPYSGKAIRKVRYNSTIGNGYNSLSLLPESFYSNNSPILKPKTRHLETFYDIFVPSGVGIQSPDVRFIRFDTPSSFPFVQGTCFNLRFNFQANNNPCIISGVVFGSNIPVLTISGANYDFVQKERVILISKGGNGSVPEFKHW